MHKTHPMRVRALIVEREGVQPDASIPYLPSLRPSKKVSPHTPSWPIMLRRESI